MDSEPLPEGPLMTSAADGPVVEIDPRYAKVVGDNMQEAVKVLLDMESTKYGIPVPTVIFEENTQLCPGTSCTIMDQKNPVRSTKIFLNPKQYSPRTILHEWHHYMATVKGPKETVAALGDGFSGDPDSEEEADRFALKEMESLFPGQVIVAADSQRINTVEPWNAPKMQSDLKVYRDSNVSSSLEAAYGWATGFTHLTAKDLNEAYTPEIIGRAAETIDYLLFTPAAAIGVEFLEGVALALIGAFAPPGMIGNEDRIMLKQIEAHLTTGVVTYADPKNLAAASAQAKQLGALVGKGNLDAALKASMNPQGNIVTGFRSALAQLQGLASGRTRQTPQTNEQPASSVMTSAGGAPPFQ